jgi:hypothetical protein
MRAVATCSNFLTAVSAVSLGALYSPDSNAGSYVSITLDEQAVTASFAALADDRAAGVTAETALDQVNELHYVFEDDFVLRSFDLKQKTFSNQTFVNLDPCMGGTCLLEMHWDSVNHRIVALGMGIDDPDNNTVVSIDPTVINHTYSPSVDIKSLDVPFDKLCGVEVGNSAFDSAGQIFYQGTHELYRALWCPLPASPPPLL